ncbi:replication endonuclease [Sulfurospirillum sp. UCH001]|uniref:replication endonuclease n=1 Tax=Sulfurospirillum sp. UCH001 TaxID=1581011 RepID=UPI00082966C8|nr:replication endonuclease [Sulfurospirillum sp. UCH001]
MLYSSKRLQATKRYKEFSSLADRYYKISLEKEHAQQSFFKNNIIANSSGECFQMYHSFEKYYKVYTKSIEQKVYTIEALAKEKNLVPVFITLTLPSHYHPFQSIEYKGKRLYTSLNPDFRFDSINSAIDEGYHFLNEVYRIFYKRIQAKVRELFFIKVFELHKTLIPHLHALFYISKEEIRIFSKHFAKICAEFNLIETEISFDNADEDSFSKVKTNINRASLYMMKYITKNLNDNRDIYEARVLDGLKREYKMRMITMSNLPLSLSDYRVIYHNLDEENKEKLLLEAKDSGVNLFTYLLKNMYQATVIKDVDSNSKHLIQFGKIEKSRVQFFKVKTRMERIGGGYSTTVESLTFFVEHIQIYKKEKFQIIKRGQTNEY